MNARPGLAIQLANRAGLWKRLEEVDRAPARIFSSAEARVEWATTVFPVGGRDRRRLSAREAKHRGSDPDRDLLPCPEGDPAERGHGQGPVREELKMENPVRGAWGDSGALPRGVPHLAWPFPCLCPRRRCVASLSQGPSGGRRGRRRVPARIPGPGADPRVGRGRRGWKAQSRRNPDRTREEAGRLPETPFS